MDIKTIRLFASLRNCTSLSQAAEKNFVSRQGLSKSIASIETELGVTLLRRSRTGFQFTSHGKKFLEHAEALIDEYDAALDDIMHDHSALAGGERINVLATSYVLGAALDSALISRILRHASINAMLFQDLIDAIGSGEPNTLFAAEVFPKSREKLERRGIEMVPIFRVEPGVLWSEENPPPNTEMATPQDLLGKTLIVNSSKTTQRYFEQAKNRAGNLSVRASVSTWPMLIDAVRSDKLIALFDSYQFKCMSFGSGENVAGLHFTPFSDKDMRFDLCVLYAKGTRLSPACTRYLNHLQADFS